ncbi:hypothetical protein NQ317_000542 [Molorchus minor]|uniref:Uncharacterized protein n=1 Tax=Molorchus minor TaxID=1323400 RepID=A0ABQ9JU41_9CUCU|nr:hypothetical protein NQ317_000542 [Molorchus minor]
MRFGISSCADRLHAMWSTWQRRLSQLDAEHHGNQQARIRIKDERAQSDAESLSQKKRIKFVAVINDPDFVL